MPQKTGRTPATRFDLVPREAVDAIARRLMHGAPIFGDFAWKNANAEQRRDCANHLAEHVTALLDGDESDNHLDAILVNSAMLAWYRAHPIVAVTPLEAGIYNCIIANVSADGKEATFVIDDSSYRNPDSKRVLKAKLRS